MRKFLDQRPDEFDIDYDHFLAQGAQLLGLGAHAGSTRFHDSSAFGNTGTLTNMEVEDWGSDLGCRSLIVDGSNEYVTLPATVVTGLVSTTPMTLSWWEYVGASPATYTGVWCLKFSDHAQRLLVLRSSSAAYATLHFSLGNAAAPFRFATAPSLAASVGVWNHWLLIAQSGFASITSTNYSCYVNGAPHVASAGSAISSQTAEYYRFGHDGADSYFKGRLKDPIIYKRALSLPEIQLLADPSNVMLSGLIRPIVARSYFPGVTLDPVVPKANLTYAVAEPAGQRPETFTINNDHPLANSLVFAGLGAHAGSTRYHDSSAFARTSVFSSGTTWDRALSRNVTEHGADGHISLPEPLLKVGTADFTLSCWIYYLSTSTYHVIMSRGNTSAGEMVFYINNTNRVRLWSGSGIDAYDPDTIAINTWYHFLARRYGATVELWRNGVLKVTDTTGAADVTSATQGCLGDGNNGASGRDFQGMLGDPMIWDRCLSTAEIQLLADPSNVMLSGLILPPVPKIKPSRNSKRRHWVGRDSDWNKSHNWAYGVAQEGGAGIPTTNDNVIIE